MFLSELQFVCAGKFRVVIKNFLSVKRLLQFVCAGKFRVGLCLLMKKKSSCNSYAQVSFELVGKCLISAESVVAIRMRR